ncbi:MAG: alpha/beta hydrolase [Oscillibacter sp.]|nr:alpha/beta hydrolase [Oscillibacter sp.]
MNTATMMLPTHETWHDYTKSVQLPTGIRMSYMECGTPGKKTLLLIHGHSDSSRIWRQLISLVEEDFHIYAVDLRGFGQSDKPVQYVYSMTQHAEDIVAFMDAVGIQSACVAAHSMGTMIAQTLAFSAPKRVEKLILAATMTHMHETPAAVKELTEMFESFDMQNMAKEDLQKNFLPFPENCADPGFPEAFFSTLRLLSGAGLAAAWRGMSVTDNRNFFQFIEAPVTILWGTEDAIFTKEYQDELREYLPDADFITLEGVAHEIPNEAADVLADTAKKFFL